MTMNLNMLLIICSKTIIKNDTESLREGNSSFIYAFLTFGDIAVYNIDSKQVIMINWNL